MSGFMAPWRRWSRVKWSWGGRCSRSTNHHESTKLGRELRDPELVRSAQIRRAQPGPVAGQSMGYRFNRGAPKERTESDTNLLASERERGSRVWEELENWGSMGRTEDRLKEFWSYKLIFFFFWERLTS